MTEQKPISEILGNAEEYQARLRNSDLAKTLTPDLREHAEGEDGFEPFVGEWAESCVCLRCKTLRAVRGAQRTKLKPGDSPPHNSSEPEEDEDEFDDDGSDLDDEFDDDDSDLEDFDDDELPDDEEEGDDEDEGN